MLHTKNNHGLREGILDGLLAPVGLHRFVRESLGKEPVLLRGAAGRVRGLISLPRVAEALLGREREQGKFLIGEGDFASQEAIRAYLDAGQPVVWNGARGATAPLDALIAELTQVFGAKVWPNVYSTGFAAKPFDAHFDLHDVLAVQCEGEKEWLVSKLRANCPLEGPEFAPAVRQALEEFRAAALAEPLMTVVTRPGDVLYIPRGQFHDARTPRGRSLHITFAIDPPTALDVLAALGPLALSETLFREYLPPAIADETGALARAHLKRVAERLAQLAGGEDVLRALGRQLATRSTPGTMRAQYALALLLAAGGILHAADRPAPILGGSLGQTMRIAVAADPASIVPCVATAGFFDSRGVLQNPPNDRPASFNLAPGQVGIEDLNLGRLVTRIGQRVELRPVVTVTSGQCSATASVFENFTGRVTAFLGLVNPPGDFPTTDPPNIFPTVGAVPGQLVRLGVARTINPPDTILDPLRDALPPACTAVLAFANGRGEAVGPAKRVELAPGQIEFLDLDPRLLPAGTGPRTVQPRLLLPASGGGDLSGCGASVQVFEQLTGWSTQAAKGK